MEVMGAFGMALFKPRDSRLRQCPLQSGIYLNSYKSPVAIWLLTGIVTLSLGKSGVKKKECWSQFRMGVIHHMCVTAFRCNIVNRARQKKVLYE